MILVRCCYLIVVLPWLSSAVGADLVGNEQTTHGACSPTIAHITGSVSIICTDPKAIEALLVQTRDLEKLALSDEQKTATIKSQQQTIARLVEGKQQSSSPDKYDLALAGLAQGDPARADKLLNDAINELEKEVAKAADLYAEKGALWFASDPPKGLVAYERAVLLAPDAADSWNQLGNLYRRTGKLNHAIAAYSQFLRLTPDRSDSHAIGAGNLGIVYSILGDSVKAIELHQKALAINTELGSKEGMAKNYGNLGIVYSILGNLDRAIELHQKALAINTQVGNKEYMAKNYDNLGIIYQKLGNLDKAIELHQKALAINTENGNKEGMATNLGNLGIAYQTEGNLDKALRLHQKALAIDISLGSKEGMANDFGNLGVVYRKRGEPDKAIRVHEKALMICTELRSKQCMAKNYDNLGIVYSALDDMDEAIELHQKALAINTELGNKEGIAISYGNLGDVHRKLGNVDQAKANWLDAKKLFEQMGALHMAAKVQDSLDQLTNARQAQHE
ncbi:MAG: tetratricopeptide repeat protein [Ketobacter sp.]|nr:MAG: tetratricopeptide repeat protein [Ketobacter sp.]